MTDDPNKKQNDPSQAGARTPQQQDQESGEKQGSTQKPKQDDWRKDQIQDKGGERKAS
jgi:hypothetical protein